MSCKKKKCETVLLELQKVLKMVQKSSLWQYAWEDLSYLRN